MTPGGQERARAGESIALALFSLFFRALILELRDFNFGGKLFLQGSEEREQRVILLGGQKFSRLRQFLFLVLLGKFVANHALQLQNFSLPGNCFSKLASNPRKIPQTGERREVF